MSTPPISTPTQTWQDWLKERLQLNLSMHHSTEIGNSLQRFEEALFSTSSRVTALICKQPANEPRRKFGDHDDFKRFLPDVRQSFEAFFVNKIGVSDDGKTPDSQSTSKLQLSREAFRYLSERCHLDIGFLYALSRSYLPAPRSFRSETDGFTSWYLVPIRIQVGCNDTRGQHATSTAGSNQMNPFHYLHLPRPGAADNGHGHPPVDIRGSHLAVHFSIRSSSNNENTDNSSSISLFVVNFLDGRYGKLIEEPRQRIQEALKGRAGNPAALDAQDVHIIIFSSVSRWWTNALQSINDQLVEHEKTLQEVADRTSNDENGAYFATLNKALHATAAHLHRYDSELTSILSTLGLLQARMQDRQDHRHLSFDDWGVTISQFEAVLALSHELEKKLKNILALLFNRIQIDYDRRMVANSVKMHEIMQAQREETSYSREIAMRSQVLAEDMKRDSISMKTIALLTLAFLPGTFFAALLATPFFTENLYLSNVNKMWIWVSLTLPVTATAFLFYILYRRKEERKMHRYQGRIEADRAIALHSRDEGHGLTME